MYEPGMKLPSLVGFESCLDALPEDLWRMFNDAAIRANTKAVNKAFRNCCDDQLKKLVIEDAQWQTWGEKYELAVKSLVQRLRNVQTLVLTRSKIGHSENHYMHATEVEPFLDDIIKVVRSLSALRTVTRIEVLKVEFNYEDGQAANHRNQVMEKGLVLKMKQAFPALNELLYEFRSKHTLDAGWVKAASPFLRKLYLNGGVYFPLMSLWGLRELEELVFGTVEWNSCACRMTTGPPRGPEHPEQNAIDFQDFVEGITKPMRLPKLKKLDMSEVVVKVKATKGKSAGAEVRRLQALCMEHLGNIQYELPKFVVCA